MKRINKLLQAVFSAALLLLFPVTANAGWIQDNGTTYYLNDAGSVVTGTRIINNSYYSFSPSGAFLGGPVPVHIEGLDDTMLADGIRQTDQYWNEINYILTLVNQERAKYGSGPLTLDKDLCNIAGYRCSYMEATGYYEHDIDGISISNDAVSRYFASSMEVGENLYYYRSYDETPIPYSVRESAEQGFNWYLQSSPHHANMVDSSYCKIGIGIYSNQSDSRRFLTLIFLP